MSFDRTQRITRGIRRPVAGAIVALAVMSGALAGGVQADPAADALAKLNELSREAEQTTEAMHSAQLDLTEKVAAQEMADAQHAADLAA
ncbi:MAG: endopeptidase, partial [Mycolicibacterium sp.]|nr:endopeptidase [Mycolicibacterium sp.]